MVRKQTKEERAIAARDVARHRERRRAERGEAAANRFKIPDVAELYGERIAIALERLGPRFMGRLTELQVEAGRHVGRLYGEYERAIGSPPRHAASPQYERAYGRSDRQSDDEWCARAIKRHARLHGVLAKLIPSPANAARAMEVLVTLCVDNQQIAAAHIPSTAVALEAIAREFELTPRRSLPPSRRAPPRENARARRAEGLSREAWADVERQFSPGITDSELEQKWRAHQAALARARAMVDREEFRRQKRRSGPR